MEVFRRSRTWLLSWRLEVAERRPAPVERGTHVRPAQRCDDAVGAARASRPPGTVIPMDTLTEPPVLLDVPRLTGGAAQPPARAAAAVRARPPAGRERSCWPRRAAQARPAGPSEVEGNMSVYRCCHL